MRHQKGIKKIGKNRSHRRAALANMATALFEHGRIYTTKAKAVALRPYAERLITTAKSDDFNSRRLVAKKLYTKEAVKNLFENVAPKYKERAGGYTRILNGNHRLNGRRLGDNAPMAMIELVDGLVSSSVEAVSTEA